MTDREVMALQTYLVHFRDRKLALAVGAELENRLAQDGRDAVALVPAGDGLGLARAGRGGRRASRGSYGGTPQVVAVYEEGLLAKLESLGLKAYVGVCPGDERGIIRWGNGGGAILLPIATARDLVDAVARHTPWSEHAARMPEFASQMSGSSRLATPALSRKLAVAGLASPLLLAGPPAVAATGATAPTHNPSAKAKVTTAVDTAYLVSNQAQSAQTLPQSEKNFLNRIDNALEYYLEQTRQSTSSDNQDIQALENEITRLLNSFVNSQPKTTSQPASSQAPQSGSAAPTNAGSQGSGSQGSGSQGQGSQGQGSQGQGSQGQGSQGQGSQGQGSQGQGSQGQQGQQGQDDDEQQPGQQGQDQQDQQGQDQQGNQDSQPSATSQGATSQNGATSQGGTTSGPGSMSSGAGTSSFGSPTASSGGGTSSGTGSTSSGGASSGGGSSS
jgi:hypothetical protein